ncbi:MAG TPA: sigma-70 family RNA polymerase sigma factor [Candidatus Paceibacterota bacterium]|nr:sigma-70 family RNA polymerase sigma factor [Candidatus Paceibacterota bacterium]HPT40277.1 sigma-70 family RNA polymerase sigma factor [Candidatus Paceibacterota bacterium]
MLDKDAQLIADYLKGDDKALEILIVKYLRQVYGLVFYYVKNESDASDLTQDVFLKMWKNLKKFKKDEIFLNWLSVIAKNTALDFIKKKKTIPFSEFMNENEENVLVETLADIKPTPDDEVAQAEITRELYAASGKLPEKYQQVVSLHYEQNLTFQEIADLLGESINTVKSRYRRAIAMLREGLGGSV